MIQYIKSFSTDKFDHDGIYYAINAHVKPGFLGGLPLDEPEILFVWKTQIYTEPFICRFHVGILGCTLWYPKHRQL